MTLINKRLAHPAQPFARKHVRDIITTLPDPESYDVEIAFRAHLRSQP